MSSDSESTDFDLPQRGELFTQLLSSLPVVFFRLDANGIFLESQGAGLKRLNLVPDQVVGMSALDMFETARPQLEHALNGESVSYETEGELLGEPWCFLTFVTPNPIPNTGILGFGIDMTEARLAREAEEQVRSQVENVERLKSLGVLAGGVAHDFNNLLTSILANTSLALAKLPPDSPVRKELSQVEQAAQTAGALCKQLLAYSGKGRFIVRPVNLSQLCSDTVRLLESSLPVEVKLQMDCPLDIPLIEADSPQLQQILMNLVLNATDSLQGPGSVTVTTGSSFCSANRLRNSYLSDEMASGTYIFMEVSDSGCGMDGPTQEKIFEPFFTTKQAGQGLGLAAVLGIMRGHSGAIEVESHLGRGTSIRMFFPIGENQTIPKQHIRPPTKAKGTSTVLFADDNATIREVARDALEHSGYRVILACDGREAIELYSSSKEENIEIDIAVLDLTMPNVSGTETFLTLRRMNSTLPILLSSGFNENVTEDQISGDNLPPFLQKPYRMQNLLSAIESALNYAKEQSVD